MWIDFENLWIYTILKKTYILVRKLEHLEYLYSDVLEHLEHLQLIFRVSGSQEKKSLKLFYKKIKKKWKISSPLSINAYN